MYTTLGRPRKGGKDLTKRPVAIGLRGQSLRRSFSLGLPQLAVRDTSIKENAVWRTSECRAHSAIMLLGASKLRKPALVNVMFKREIYPNRRPFCVLVLLEPLSHRRPIPSLQSCCPVCTHISALTTHESQVHVRQNCHVIECTLCRKRYVL